LIGHKLENVAGGWRTSPAIARRKHGYIVDVDNNWRQYRFGRKRQGRIRIEAQGGHGGEEDGE
jgi:hypothetical protein